MYAFESFLLENILLPNNSPETLLSLRSHNSLFSVLQHSAAFDKSGRFLFLQSSSPAGSSVTLPSL